MPNLSSDTETFITEFDAAIEAHMAWTRRILRCAVLRELPGDDVMDTMAHTLCRFGCWFSANKGHFEGLDGESVQRIDVVHQAMHDAIRSICHDVMEGRPGQSADLEAFEQTQGELLGLLARIKTLTLSNAVRHDPLTGLPLRYGIENEFALCQSDAKRNGTLLYAALIDVDHFKRFNDDHGHAVGDLALRHLADSLRHILRGNEPLYRYGGEEFLWLLRCQSDDEAHAAARRVVSTIGELPVPLDDGQALPMTITIGLAHVGQAEDITSALKRADGALYEGKRAGRNRYVMANP